MFPLLSKAIALPLSDPEPPNQVLNNRALPEEFSFVTKPSRPPPIVFCAALVLGKFVEYVHPVTATFPEASTAIPKARSSPLPPRYVA